jgi:DNA-binding MarR family transcriptional regulator
MEVVESTDYLRFSPYNISFLSDDIIAMRYVELDGLLRKVLAVIKMRGSDHSRALRAYDVTTTGLAVLETLEDYRGVITGVPEPRRDSRPAVRHPELTPVETRVLEAVLRLGETAASRAADEAGLTLDTLVAALDRLIAADYLQATERDGHTVYRATIRAVR